MYKKNVVVILCSYFNVKFVVLCVELRIYKNVDCVDMDPNDYFITSFKLKLNEIVWYFINSHSSISFLTYIEIIHPL